MPYTRVEIAKHAEKLGRSSRTLRRWIRQGFNPNNRESVEKFLAEAERKKTNVRRYLEARRLTAARPKAQRRNRTRDPGTSSTHGNGDLPPAGAKRAAAALQRLESQEEQSHRRLLQAQATGD
jgi:hypothetical protein